MIQSNFFADLLDGRWEVRLGDSREVLREVETNSIDSVVTDPPYELGFMNRKWDSSGIAYDVGLWSEVLRVLKPGGYLVSFGGSRTYHRMAVAIEDAGFEIRDQLLWVYGSGFPKSQDVSRHLDDRAFRRWLAENPEDAVRLADASDEEFDEIERDLRRLAGCEREVIGYKDSGLDKASGVSVYMSGTPSRAENGLIPVTKAATELGRRYDGWGTALKPAHEPIVLARKPLVGTIAENIERFGTGAMNIPDCRVDAGDLGDDSVTLSIDGEEIWSPDGRFPANLITDGSDEVGDVLGRGLPPDQNPVRFFYSAKATRAEREHGLDELAAGIVARSNGAQASTTRGDDASNASGYNRTTVRRNIHPTVKPTDLMRYLVRLVTPREGLVLDPFCGSGTTGKAAMREGMRFLGVEITPEYAEIARLRISQW